MVTSSQVILCPTVEYPETDGLPMAENTLQFQWIVTIKEGLEAVFRDDPQVFVAGDLFWYPVEGNNRIRAAPDTMVVFGRPKGHRRSYLQWNEGGIPPQVVFEVLSPGNTEAEMQGKLEFYQQHGVDEYYVYDPDRVTLSGWRRQGDVLVAIPEMDGWHSPRLGVRFDMGGPELRILGPDGVPFATYAELYAARAEAMEQMLKERQRADEERQRAMEEQQRADEERRQANEERQRAMEERQRADEERQRANEERQRAMEEQQRADEERRRANEERQRAMEERQRADEERQRAERLAAQLRSLGIEPEA